MQIFIIDGTMGNIQHHPLQIWNYFPDYMIELDGYEFVSFGLERFKIMTSKFKVRFLLIGNIKTLAFRQNTSVLKQAQCRTFENYQLTQIMSSMLHFDSQSDKREKFLYLPKIKFILKLLLIRYQLIKMNYLTVMQLKTHY